MELNFNKLRGKIVEKYEKQSNFAEALGIKPQTLSNKLNNHGDFRADEISKSCELLDIPYAEIPSYFFTLKVQTTEQNVSEH